MFPTRIYNMHHLFVAFIGLQTMSMACPPPLSPPTPSVCHTQCPARWRHMNGACYIMVTDPLPWAQAENHCSELVKEACGNGVSGHLASINSERENNFARYMWQLMGRGDIAIDMYYWIGLSKQAGQLLWTDGSLPFYTNWETGVEETLDSTADVCVYVAGQRRRWNTADCSNPLNRVYGLPFACELAQNQDLSVPPEVPGPA